MKIDYRPLKEILLKKKMNADIVENIQLAQYLSL